MTRLLVYLCDKYFAGESDLIKEYNIAVDLLGRSPNFDPADNASARVEVHRLRKKLKTYYETEGAVRELRIEIPSGSYVPQFVPRRPEPNVSEQPVTAAIASSAVIAAVEPQPPSIVALTLEEPPLVNKKPLWRQWAWSAPAAVGVILALGAAVLMLLNRKPNPEFAAFWGPAVSSTAAPVLVMPHPIVYHPTARARQLHDQLNEPPALPTQVPLKVPANQLTGSDFVPVFDQYVGFGDTVAAVNLNALFAGRADSMKVRLASKTDFSDLRDSPSVLLGAFTNRWTIELTQKFRFRFAMGNHRKPAIADRDTAARWSTDKLDNGSSNEDYILICRLPNSQTGGLVVIGAGLTQYGTQEAGRILTHPQALTPILRQLPKGWESKNVELVLRSQIVGGTPTAPDLTAFHVW